MNKIYEHSKDVHVKNYVVYGKTGDKKLYYEPEYKTQVSKADMEDAFLKGLLLIDDGTNNLRNSKWQSFMERWAMLSWWKRRLVCGRRKSSSENTTAN